MPHNADYLPSTVSIRTEPIQQRSADRITNLLDAAAELISENGIDGLTTSDVAVRSHSSVGVVYRYFPNIQSLLRALGARNMDLFMTRVHERLAGVTEWQAALDAIVDEYVELMRTQPSLRAIGFGDVIDQRFLRPETSNSAVLAKEFADTLATKFSLKVGSEFEMDLEVAMEVTHALIRRSFLHERDGDERYIEKLRGIVSEQLRPYTPAT
jgi:AcrR family transcriptional regulator